jgi:hypothetical protein
MPCAEYGLSFIFIRIASFVEVINTKGESKIKMFRKNMFIIICFLCCEVILVVMYVFKLI